MNESPNHSDTFDIGGELTVDRVGFGAMSLAGSGNMGWPDDVSHARTVLERALELGVDFVDTADMYGNGSSESIVGEVVGDDDDVAVATKGAIMKQPDANTVVNGDPAYLKNAALRSRVRLRTETIDLYYYHFPDEDVPFEDSVTALSELQDDGVIEHVGLSNVSVDQIERAREITDVAAVQNRYNVADREHEDVLEYCEDHDIAFVAYSPMAKADLDERSDVLDEIADAHDATRYQIALAWLLARSPNVLPIPGTANLEHLADNVAAAEIELTDEEYTRLSE
ncbi:aldo/keto reductase [Halobacteria archaeon AArc-m2/3/4]|uniref:Aldo/keto reductase n=1 Tax=Natronoglomus mannanivorans TaxID=2979990 RepID=A0AAP3E0C6_9EURY|nr:aldo/keto reductase [Halobacteria archaeon AArc-xg1-1]MCU4973123.1 aldo/keto reductase [Halobacteria archaeon AArc-m2/3/4]